MKVYCEVTILLSILLVLASAEHAVADAEQYRNVADGTTNGTAANTTVNIDDITTNVNGSHRRTEVAVTISGRLYSIIVTPICTFLNTPKVSNVIKNIGVCIVNGAMEIISYYVPAPMIPLIASVAGMVIPFEPVVMLKQKMPVTSYRRAFQTAVKGFLNTFDKYKVDNEFDDDPYMTRRFNRRFMDNGPNDLDKIGQKGDPQIPIVISLLRKLERKDIVERNFSVMNQSTDLWELAEKPICPELKAITKSMMKFLFSSKALENITNKIFRSLNQILINIFGAPKEVMTAINTFMATVDPTNYNLIKAVSSLSSEKKMSDLVLDLLTILEDYNNSMYSDPYDRSRELFNTEGIYDKIIL